ncbi:MAG: hypothetical protein FWF67_02195 [Fibromonadales bacterium]|nr:hypothetical protein [Fibromonadales bacterium]
MSRQFMIILEYDGKNPIRNTFLCGIGELEYSILRDWEDLYDGDLSKYPDKKRSIKTLERSSWHGCYSWGIEKIAKKIEMIKKEIKLDIELDKKGKITLKKIIRDLQRLHDIALAKCKENNIKPEKCYINWWIDC